MTKEEFQNFLSDHGYEETLFFDDPRLMDAIIGISHDERVIYSYDKMYESLANSDMEEEDVADYISYGLIRGLAYEEKSPIIMYEMENL